MSLAEDIVDAVGEILGVDTAGNCIEDGTFLQAIRAVERLLFLKGVEQQSAFAALEEAESLLEEATIEVQNARRQVEDWKFKEDA